jgi:hypothetical protein
MKTYEAAGLFIVLLIAAILLLVVGGIFIGLDTDKDEKVSPQQVWEDHIRALSDGEWELAHSLLSVNCPFTVADVKDTWESETIDPARWKVDKTFIGEDSALLWFKPSDSLRLMIREDGDWKISCTGDIP